MNENDIILLGICIVAAFGFGVGIGYIFFGRDDDDDDDDDGQKVMDLLKEKVTTGCNCPGCTEIWEGYKALHKL